MSTREYNAFDKKTCWIFLLFSILIFLIYSNTFHASWHFDDVQNILKDENIHIKDLRVASLSKSIRLWENNKIFRPVSRLTFAVNWYFGREDVTGYHIVNTIIHLLTAWFLFLTVSLLLRTPAIRDRYHGSERFIAALTAVFWATNPIQTQAVTYIVQRMASLAAMFYILSLFFYLKGRSASSSAKKYVFFVGTCACFLLGLGSKENVIVLPIALILLEATFFQDLGDAKTRRVLFWTMVGGGFLTVFIASLVFLDGNPLFFLKNYSNRFFTPLERLMTEPRILLLYLSQIFYPVPTRLSIEHDITLSTSLLNPWTTLPGIALVLALIFFSLWKIQKMPVLSFALLFFFLNHVVESTVLNLEPVFEHRNYLPSLFLFFPVAILIKRLLDHYYEKRRPMFYILVSFFILLIIGFGSGTYIRNMVWTTERSLWEDAAEKAPNMMRPVHNIGLTYERAGQFDKALEMYRRALTLKAHSNNHKALSYNNIAAISYYTGNYEKAEEFWSKACDIYPEFEGYEYRLALALTKQKKWEKASRHLEAVLAKRPDFPDFLRLKGIVLLNQNRPLEAVDSFGKWLRFYPDSPDALYHTGLAFGLMGEYQRAQFFLKRARVLDFQNVSVLLSLIDIGLTAGDKEGVIFHVNALFSSASLHLIKSSLKEMIENNVELPISKHRLIREIAGKLEEKSSEIVQLETFLNSRQR